MIRRRGASRAVIASLIYGCSPAMWRGVGLGRRGGPSPAKRSCRSDQGEYALSAPRGIRWLGLDGARADSYKLPCLWAPPGWARLLACNCWQVGRPVREYRRYFLRGRLCGSSEGGGAPHGRHARAMGVWRAWRIRAMGGAGLPSASCGAWEERAFRHTAASRARPPPQGVRGGACGRRGSRRGMPGGLFSQRVGPLGGIMGGGGSSCDQGEALAEIPQRTARVRSLS